MSKPKYTPEKLVAVSRYQNYFPTLSAPIMIIGMIFSTLVWKPPIAEKNSRIY